MCHYDVLPYLDDMSVEEEGAELVLQEAEPNQPAHIAEGVQPHLRRPALPRSVETALARLIEQRRRLFALQQLLLLLFATRKQRETGGFLLVDGRAAGGKWGAGGSGRSRSGQAKDVQGGEGVGMRRWRCGA